MTDVAATITNRFALVASTSASAACTSSVKLHLCPGENLLGLLRFRETPSEGPGGRPLWKANKPKDAVLSRLTSMRTEIEHDVSPITRTGQQGPGPMAPISQPKVLDQDELEAAVDDAIAACDGDLRATIRALITANHFLESEVAELMKAVSHAFARGRFHAYSG